MSHLDEPIGCAGLLDRNSLYIGPMGLASVSRRRPTNNGHGSGGSRYVAGIVDRASQSHHLSWRRVLQLIDDEPPQSFAVDLASGDECVGDAYTHLEEAFHDEGLVALEEYGVYVLNERPWRVFPVKT